MSNIIRNFLIFGQVGRLKINKNVNINRFNQSRALTLPKGPLQTSRPATTKQQNELHEARDNFNFSILRDEFSNSRHVIEAGSEIELDDLELNLLGRKLHFNLTWLRDSCRCNKCTHEYSRQRILTTNDFKKQMFSIDDVNISDGNQLEIKWRDGHQSSYSISWLIHVDSLYEKSKLSPSSGFKERQTFYFPRDDFYSATKDNDISPEYWDVPKIKSDLKPIDYGDLLDGFAANQQESTTYINANKISEMTDRRYEAMLALTKQLVAYGLAKIVNVPAERNQVLKVARSLAYERPTGYGTVFDVVVEPNEEINLAYTAQEFDLHTDLAYRETSPGVQLLHCIRNSVQGGLSYFSDVHHAANKLRELDPKLFDVLVHFPATFIVRDPYRSLKFRRQQPILALDYQGRLSDVHYGPFMLPPVGHKEDVKLFYLAMDKLTKILQSHENKLVEKMDPGDLYIFHNRRVLHGRSAYDPTTSERFLQGCYMDWDEIKCLHEKLLSNKKSGPR